MIISCVMASRLPRVAMEYDRVSARIFELSGVGACYVLNRLLNVGCETPPRRHVCGLPSRVDALMISLRNTLKPISLPPFYPGCSPAVHTTGLACGCSQFDRPRTLTLTSSRVWRVFG